MAAHSKQDATGAAQGGELIALTGGAPALFIYAASRAAVGQAQELVEQVQQLVAALDHQRVQQHQQQRVPAGGLKAPELLGGHPAAQRLKRSPPSWRQHAHVDSPAPSSTSRP